MGAIELNSVSKAFGATRVIRDVSLSIPDGAFTIFVGPSGCGKSTLLRLIAGLDPVSGGRILLDGAVVTATPPSRRGLAMVFQSYALYPHMTVAENMAFGLRTRGVGKPERRAAAARAGEVLRLGALLDRKPKALSGGQRQRVAIGRCIVREPEAFLFDEPLSNLDAALRVEMRFELARLHQTLNTTMIYVTHDQVEAMTLADQIVVLKAGEVQQVGPPREIYERPANRFVAQFIGSPRMNVMPAEADGAGVRVAGAGRAPVPVALPRRPATLGIRPEHIALAADGAGDLRGRIEVAEYLGADTYLYVDAGLAEPVLVRHVGDAAIHPGDAVELAFQRDRLSFFDDDDQTIAPMRAEHGGNS